MKERKIINYGAPLTVFFFILMMNCCLVNAKNNSPEMLCHSYVVMDAGSGKVIYGQDEDKKIYPASTAKLMTAIVCVEKADIDQKIKVKSSIVNNTSEGTYCLGIRAGETFTFKQLLHMSLMASAADATDTMAAGVFGSKKACVKAMNKKCKELGLTQTSFDNPVGSDIGAGYKHTYSTAREMAEITRYASSKKLIRNICAKSYYEAGDYSFSSTNWFLTGAWGYSKSLYKIIGSKSGTTNAAGHVFIATASDLAGHEVICAYFGNVSKESTFKGIRILLDKTFKQYKKGKIKLTKGNYDVRYDEDLKDIYDKLAQADCLPEHEGNTLEKNSALTRSQLADMLRYESCLKKSDKLTSYEKEKPDEMMTSKSLAKMINYLFPGSIKNEDSDSEVSKFLTDYQLLSEESARGMGHVITREEGLKLMKHMSDYIMQYMSKHAATGYMKDLGVERLTDIAEFDKEWLNSHK